jgi:hypothetical protein
MGRGRAKAKQTKVARELKYGGPDMDLNRLRNDLGSAPAGSVEDEIDAAYAAYLGEDDDDEEDDDED